MQWEQGQEALIKMQEKQIRELEHVLDQMQRRDDAVLHCLEEHEWSLDKWEANNIRAMLSPLEKDRRQIFRTEDGVSIFQTGKGRWFQGDVFTLIDREINRKEMKRINTLYEYLQGNLPNGVTCYAPKLSKKKAFSVIWFLQEVINCLPQKFECCSICGDIYDSESEGHHSDLTGKSYCGNCFENDAPVTRCWDCGEDVLTDKAWSEKYNEYLCENCKKERDEQERDEEKESEENV